MELNAWFWVSALLMVVLSFANARFAAAWQRVGGATMQNFESRIEGEDPRAQMAGGLASLFLLSVVLILAVFGLAVWQLGWATAFVLLGVALVARLVAAAVVGRG